MARSSPSPRTHAQARVNRTTGQVTFHDAAGQLVLAERRDGRTFTPATVMGEQAWRVRQRFDSPPDEALYGLGQHQNGVFNYKNADVDLFQYNIVAAVPFLVSSRNYGLLWDNNSRTHSAIPASGSRSRRLRRDAAAASSSRVHRARAAA